MLHGQMLATKSLSVAVRHLSRSISQDVMLTLVALVTMYVATQ
jgi:hypothetical protein